MKSKLEQTELILRNPTTHCCACTCTASQLYIIVMSDHFHYVSGQFGLGSDILYCFVSETLVHCDITGPASDYDDICIAEGYESIVCSK